MRRESITRLVVRAPNWIGDAVMCEPAIRGLRSLFPHAELTVLAKAVVADMFIGYPGVDHILRYEDKGIHAGLAGKWTLAGTLRRKRFDLAVLFQNAFEAAFLTWLADIPRRYGYATDGRAIFLTDPVAVPDPGLMTHQVGYYWNMLRLLGLSGEAPTPALTLLSDEERAMGDRLASAGIESDDILIGINPGSTYGGAKRWLPERFAETARKVVGQLGEHAGTRAAVVILGAKGEEQLGRDIAAKVETRSMVLSGSTTIRELMAVTKRCRVLLTNDTGPMHIAAAYGVPVVAVFGPTDWRTTSPYGQSEAVVREPVDCAPCLLRECPIDHRCMTGVSVERVFGVAMKQLEGVSGSFGSSGLCNARERGANKTNETNQINQTHLLEGYTIFLDRDGTLNRDPGYIRSPEQFELFPGVPQAMAKVKQAGARCIMVTNQSGIARGFLSIGDLDAIHAKLERLLGEAGVSLDAIYFCPHHPDDACGCRKPNTGLIDRAVRERQVDLARSYVIGDHVRDIELAKSVGARSILVTTGVVRPEQVESLIASGTVPDGIAPSFAEAMDWLLEDAKHRCAQESGSP
ncbi:MAG: lipopolysaccharide heptosyltransferase II [Nitrospira sp.]|nr:lipopolysaccharide heptosyltransferase II [Nitrospira sp.]